MAESEDRSLKILFHLNKATDPIEREFTEQMMIEEKGHYNLLVDMKYYLTDPDNWFAGQEKISIFWCVVPFGRLKSPMSGFDTPGATHLRPIIFSPPQGCI